VRIIVQRMSKIRYSTCAETFIFDTYGCIKWRKASKIRTWATCYMHECCGGKGCGSYWF